LAASGVSTGSHERRRDGADYETTDRFPVDTELEDAVEVTRYSKVRWEREQVVL
jgi:hypothetical protein